MLTVVLDLGVALETEPLGDRAVQEWATLCQFCASERGGKREKWNLPVLLGSLGEDDLGTERLVGRHLAIV